MSSNPRVVSKSQNIVVHVKNFFSISCFKNHLYKYDESMSLVVSVRQCLSLVSSEQLS